jgi:predicted RNA-binding protein with PIN domain
LLIDGYNLMHAAGLARRRYGPRQLERCRLQLLRHLAQYLTASERQRATIVFDAAAAPPDLRRQMKFEEMTVCFAPPGHEADDTIEELIAAHSAPRQIRMVSSDHRLQRSARKRRGSFVDSEEFVEELERRGPISKEPEQPRKVIRNGADAKEQGAETDTQAWLRVFEGAAEIADSDLHLSSSGQWLTKEDVAAIEREVNREEAAGRRSAGRRKRK